jgi:hypothetical protein
MVTFSVWRNRLRYPASEERSLHTEWEAPWIQILSGRFGKETNLWPLPCSEPQILGRAACRPVTMPTSGVLCETQH